MSEQKFDAVVEYTVHLTADRDNVVAQLERIRQDMSAKKRENSPSKEKDISPNRRNAEKRNSNIGSFSFFFVILVAILAFLGGRYFS